MKILFDAYGAQILADGGTGSRLSGLYAALDSQEVNYEHRVASGALTSNDLVGIDILVLTTRMETPYTVAELTAITLFVQRGGGLWCMANHGGFNQSRIMDNFTRYVSTVSSTFWTSYEAAAYLRLNAPTEVILDKSNLSSHEIISGNPSWPILGGKKTNEISEVVTRSFCGIYPNAFADTICTLNNLNGVVNAQNNQPITQGVVWAMALENVDVVGAGRVVIGADSGWLGDTTSMNPGPGEFQNGDNAQFAINVLSWLGKRP